MEAPIRTTKILSLSLPPELLRKAETLARQEGRTKSELLREALRRYVHEQEWRSLQRYGARRARRLGIREHEVERVLAEYRKTR